MKPVTSLKVMKTLKHTADSLVNAAEKFIQYADRVEAPTGERKRSKQERQLLGALKHIAKYGKNTALHTFPVQSSVVGFYYSVRQMLDGTWNCDCDDACKHIARAKSNPDNLTDISYGQGAIEAHRRLTGLAKQALEPKPKANCAVKVPQLKGDMVPESAAKFKLQYKGFFGEWLKSGTYMEEFTKEGAQVIIDREGTNGMPYRMVPVESKLYKLQFDDALGNYLDSNTYSGVFTKEQAQQYVDQSNRGMKYRVVPA